MRKEVVPVPSVHYPFVVTGEDAGGVSGSGSEGASRWCHRGQLGRMWAGRGCIIYCASVTNSERTQRRCVGRSLRTEYTPLGF
jgi:hypothetical protein